MTKTPEQQRELERTRYWQGQMLKSGDLSGQVSTDLQLRWWHNRALHNAYGVAYGYESTPLYASSILNGLEFEPGVAYDCLGRSLILLRPHQILIPKNSQAAHLTLVARYRESCEFPDPREIDGVCLTCCEDSMSAEHPVFFWTSADPPDPRAGVPLVRVTFDPKKRLHLLDLGFQLMTTEPLARPYLASGSTVKGGTPWMPWIEQQVHLGFETDVDTSAAGFGSTPCYFAWLENLDPLALHYAPVAGIFTHISDPTPLGFKFRILLARDQRVFIKFLPPTLAYVCWLGCESRADTSQCLNPEVRKSCCG